MTVGPSHRAGLVLHGLVDGRVERLALQPERLETELLRDGHQLVGHGLERAGEVAVGLGAVEVVEHGEQLGHELHPRPDQHALPVALHAPPVVGVLRADPLQVGRALRHLGASSAAATASGPTACSAACSGWSGPAPADCSAGTRTSPVTGSIRRRSRTTTRSPSPFSAPSLRSCRLTSCCPSPRRRSRRPPRRRVRRPARRRPHRRRPGWHRPHPRHPAAGTARSPSSGTRWRASPSPP